MRIPCDYLSLQGHGKWACNVELIIYLLIGWWKCVPSIILEAQRLVCKWNPERTFSVRFTCTRTFINSFKFCFLLWCYTFYTVKFYTWTVLLLANQNWVIYCHKTGAKQSVGSPLQLPLIKEIETKNIGVILINFIQV